MKSLYVVLFIASIAANIPHASGQVGTQINIDKLLGQEVDTDAVEVEGDLGELGTEAGSTYTNEAFAEGKSACWDLESHPDQYDEFFDVSQWKADVKECRRKFYRFSRRLSEHNLDILVGFKRYLRCRRVADMAQLTLVKARLEESPTDGAREPWIVGDSVGGAPVRDGRSEAADYQACLNVMAREWNAGNTGPAGDTCEARTSMECLLGVMDWAAKGARRRGANSTRVICSDQAVSLAHAEFEAWSGDSANIPPFSCGP